MNSRGLLFSEDMLSSSLGRSWQSNSATKVAEACKPLFESCGKAARRLKRIELIEGGENKLIFVEVNRNGRDPNSVSVFTS